MLFIRPFFIIITDEEKVLVSQRTSFCFDKEKQKGNNARSPLLFWIIKVKRISRGENRKERVGIQMTFDFSYILVGLMEIFSHFVQGCTGFGATVIAAPVVTGLLGTDVGVPYGTLVTMPMLYVLGIKCFKEVSWKDLLKICILMAPGMLVGNILFAKIPATYAKVAIGFIVTAIALKNCYNAFIRDTRKKNQEQTEETVNPDSTAMKIFRYGCLLLGGCVHGAFNIGGPLITVYTIYSVKDKGAFRATMTWVWILMNTCFNMVAQFTSGRYDTPILWSALAIGVPMAAVGFFLGHLFHKKINRELFLKCVYVCLLVVGGDMFIRALLAVIAA